MPEENSILIAAAKANLSKRVTAIRQMLLDLHKDPAAKDRSNDHRKIYELYNSVSDPNKFRDAAENVRVQQGIKERFEKGLEQSRKYLGTIRRVFREEGMPEEIAYLPLVESSFNNQAVSRTRAAGIWQFMPGTARIYKIRINSDVDERLDPAIATRAAARYLKRSYEMFGSWPLALTSYNHGQYGIATAIKTVGSDSFMKIVKQYDGRSFGFASRNFYAEFLAACRVMKDAEKYFGAIDYEKPVVSDSVLLTKSLWVSTILNGSNLSREDIRIHNPALQSAVIFSRRPIPAGYRLHLPEGRFSDPVAFITQLRGAAPSSTKVAAAKTLPPASTSSTSRTYIVRKGDTLFSISRKFATTVDILRQLNDLNHNHIFPGQRLFVGSR
jgi:membrane-bound lytic murein transglycosylase D